MRVEQEELSRVRNGVVKRGERYSGSNLEGATIDAAYALENAGFTAPTFKKTGELKQMVVYQCRPDWGSYEVGEVVQRLETAWAEDGAFTDEVHTLTVADDAITMDFVTWWDTGGYYTGRIEVALTHAE
jgi:hypothetical protein